MTYEFISLLPNIAAAHCILPNSKFEHENFTQATSHVIVKHSDTEDTIIDRIIQSFARCASQITQSDKTILIISSFLHGDRQSWFVKNKFGDQKHFNKQSLIGKFSNLAKGLQFKNFELWDTSCQYGDAVHPSRILLSNNHDPDLVNLTVNTVKTVKKEIKTKGLKLECCKCNREAPLWITFTDHDNSGYFNMVSTKRGSYYLTPTHLGLTAISELENQIGKSAGTNNVCTRCTMQRFSNMFELLCVTPVATDISPLLRAETQLKYRRKYLDAVRDILAAGRQLTTKWHSLESISSCDAHSTNLYHRVLNQLTPNEHTYPIGIPLHQRQILCPGKCCKVPLLSY